MHNILIGSRALHYWYPSMKTKDDADWDIISDRPFVNNTQNKMRFEWHDPLLLNNKDFEYYTSIEQTIDILGQKVYICTPMGLAIIKRSHLWRDLKFGKHITHYHKYLSWCKDNFSKKDCNMLEERTKMTHDLYPQGNPNLMQSKEDFFDDAVKKQYDHDYLHELFAHYDKPLYTTLLRSADLAWCEESKWQKLSHEDKLKCIAEEVQVIATERFMVPNNWKYPSKLAYNKALDKVCTTLCSGWFRDYAIDSYPQLLDMYEVSKFDKVKKVLDGPLF